MNKEELIETIKEAFKDEKHPGEFNLVYDNSGKHIECIEVRELFKDKTWDSLPDNFMFEEHTALSSFSKEAFKYYLPAFMLFSIRSYEEADVIPDNLVYDLTLPTEADTIKLANDIKRYKLDKKMSEIDFNEILQNSISNMDKSINNFIQRVKLFTDVQSEAILAFLEYINTYHSDDFFNDEPTTAINRYWFAFR